MYQHVPAFNSLPHWFELLPIFLIGGLGLSETRENEGKVRVIGIKSAKNCSAANPCWLALTVNFPDESEKPGSGIDFFLDIFDSGIRNSFALFLIEGLDVLGA